MKILVTGGAGFIASHVVDAYIRLGHEVFVLDDLSRGDPQNLNSRAHFYPVDIQDREQVGKLFASEKPEVVNHHAAQMDVRRGVKEPHFDASVNILDSLNVIEAAVAHGAARFIYASTAGAAYGEPKDLPVSEDCPVHPITPYGISKHTVEHYLFTFSHLYGIPYVVLRYGNVYGPRQSSRGEAGVFAIFCEQMIDAIQPVIYGDGQKVRDYVYIDDVVQANVAALENAAGEIFNIGSGVPTTDKEIFNLVRNLLGKSGVVPRYVAKRPGEIDRIYLDITKAKEQLGWRPCTSLAEGAHKTVSYFRQAARKRRTTEAQRLAISGAPSN